MKDQLQFDPGTTADQIRKFSSLRPTLAMVLGSGFSHVLSGLRVTARISYRELHGFLAPSVTGHSGELIMGFLRGTPVLVLSGRSHFYEGHPMERITFPIRVLADFGIRDLLLTNAAGGINRRFKAGDFMVLTDHINFIGANPLRGEIKSARSRFVDLSEAYDPKLRALLQRAGRKAGMKLRSGVYIAVSGPSYETPAEIKAFARLGADAVGMSTVPEVIVARQCGLRVAAVSCITNLAAGRTGKTISHKEVLETGERVKTSAARLLECFLELYGKEFLDKGNPSRKLRV
jgi:purine-nucleoside phosphorylase